MENENGHPQRQRRGRSGSRASSTSSSLEVRCACQYYRSDSLLPERSALTAASRPAAKHTAQRMVQTPPAGRRPPVRCGDHEYEPIGEPMMRLAVSQHSVVVRSIAPVVKITDTDVVPVADSDDSIDDRYRFQHGALILDGDVILPLDGRIEDDAMDGRNLGDQTTVDTSGDELDSSAQQLQERIEDRFFVASTEERNGLDNLPPAQQHQQMIETVTVRDEQEARSGLQQRLKSQAGKIRSRFKNIQKPTFKIPRGRSATAEKKTTTPPASPRGAQKASRMERFRMALPERPRFTLPDKSKFHLPDRSKFHMKKPRIQLPKSLSRPRPSSSQREATQEPSIQETSGESKSGGGTPRRNIFDFSTLPRPKKLFERKAKPSAKAATTTAPDEYVTSSPKESRAQSLESSTFPRTKKPGLSARWAQRFSETVRGFHEEEAKESAVDRSTPWRHPSLEEPRLSLKPQTTEELEEKLPWESAERKTLETTPTPAEEEEPSKPNEGKIVYADKEAAATESVEEVRKDPRLETEYLLRRIELEEPKRKLRLVEEDQDAAAEPEAEDKKQTYQPKALYAGTFPPVDPPEFRDERGRSVELSEDEEGSSMRSDREIQQSSGSSCERRRRGVIEEIDSDEFFAGGRGPSEENVRLQLLSEMRQALAAEAQPPAAPERARRGRKRMDESSFEAPAYSSQQSFERTGSLSSRHRIVYHTELPLPREPDDECREYPDESARPRSARRKSLGSHGRLPIDEQNIVLLAMQQPDDVPPVAPRRRKRLRRDHQSSSLSIRTVDSAMHNGFAHSHERMAPTPPAYGDYIEPVAREQQAPPMPPKRTRSRTASLAPEDDRTSRGADSLPGDFGFVDEDMAPAMPRGSSSSSREPSLPGYAVIDKREKPPRPPPPRRKRQDNNKFATAPRPAAKTGPKRPLRNYSTLRPANSDTIRSSDSMPFMDCGDFERDEDLHREPLRSGCEWPLRRIQDRPLPAPPRPPRHRRGTPTIRARSPAQFITADFSETVASTQTDPLPDDLVIEEEVTMAKLVVTPSLSGSSQVLISTERQASPTSGSYQSAATPPIPPLPPLSTGVQPRNAVGEKAVDRENEASLAPSDEPKRLDRPSQLEILRSALFSTDEPIRIPSLEVADLRVERLTVSQLEAYKVAASEIDAIVISASEMSSKGETEYEIHPTLLQELIAIRNQLEAVRAAQPSSRPQSSMEDAYTATSNECVDVPIEEQKKKERQSDRKSFTRESSPLLIVQTPASEQEATVEMGRTVFPLGTSSFTATPDLSTRAESTTVSEATAIATSEVIESLITISEKPSAGVEESAARPASRSDDTSTSATTKTTTRVATSATAPDQQRSGSSSPSRSSDRAGVVRQTASPVKSLPPVISVTPDSIMTPGTQDSMLLRHTMSSSEAQPQRAVISYRASSDEVPANSSASSRESSRSPPPITPTTHYIAFPTSHVPAEFFSLANNPPLTATAALAASSTHPARRHHHYDDHYSSDPGVEPSIADTARQLLRALRHAGNRSFRHFVDSVVSRFGAASNDDDDEVAEPEQKVRRVELALCALLVLVACLILVCICTPRTVTHHHHWDYFNPPQ